MTFTGLRRDPRKHRAIDRVSVLEGEIRYLEGAFTLLQQERREAIDTGDALRVRAVNAERVACCAMGELQERTVERDRLAEQVEGLQLRLAPLLAAEANANAISIPAGVRDIDPDEQVTHPIDVRELRERFNAGPVVFSLHQSPLAADPAHIPVPAA